jgi:hypothetical protein
MAAVCAAAAQRAPAGDAVTIKRQFNPGEKVYIQQDSHIDQTIEMGPTTMKMKMRQLYGVWEAVKKSGGGTTDVELTFDRALQTLESPMMGNMKYDSDDPDNEENVPTLANILQNVVGGTMTMNVGPDGKVIAFSGMDAIREKVASKAAANMFWQQMKHEYTDDGARKKWGEGPLLAYPNKEVGVGDEWESDQTSDVPQVGTLLIATTYRLKEITSRDGRKVAVIATDQTITRRADDDEDADATPRVQGSANGELVYDIERGRVTHRTSKDSLKIQMPMPGAPADPEGNKPMMKAGIEIDTTVDVLSEKDRARQKDEMRRKIEERKRKAAAEEVEGDDDENDDLEDLEE